MAIERVPFFIGGGAEHSADVARTLAHSATGGLTGVTARGDLKIVAQGTPQASVLVSPGSASLASNYVGGNTQSYIARVPSATTVQIEPTGSATGRSDAIVLTITDPQYIGSAPTDVNNFDYTRVEVISGVSSTLRYTKELNLNRPAILLARVDIPKSTGAITQSMITDCRVISNAKRDRQLFTYQWNGTQATSDGTNFTNVPGSTVPTVFIPQWATHVIVRGDVFSLWINGSVSNPTSFVGGIRVDVAGQVTPSSFIHHVCIVNGSRFDGTATGKLAIPESIRGTTRNTSVQIAGFPGTTAPWVWDGSSRASIDLEFIEEPE